MPPKIPTKLPAKIATIRPPAADWKRALETGMQFTELRRSQARAIVTDLVAQGHLARDQMGAAVDEVVEMSRRRSDDLRKVVQTEVQRQLGALGLATKADLNALERRMTRANRETKKKTGPSKKAAKKSPKKLIDSAKAAPKPAPKAG
jgi:polyhydroxyalkanoate synthesis regulator phasin